MELFATVQDLKQQLQVQPDKSLLSSSNPYQEFGLDPAQFDLQANQVRAVSANQTNYPWHRAEPVGPARIAFSLGYNWDFYNSLYGDNPPKIKMATIPVVRVDLYKNERNSYGSYAYQQFHIRGGNYYGDLTCTVIIRYQGAEATVTTSFEVAEKVFGLKIDPQLNLCWAGGQQAFPLQLFKEVGTKFTWNSLDTPYRFITDPESRINVLRALIAQAQGVYDKFKLSGIGKLHKIVNPIAEKLAVQEPRAFIAYRSLIENTSRTLEKIKLSTVANQLLTGIIDDATYLAVFNPMYQSLTKTDNHWRRNFDTAIQETEAYKGLRKTTLKAHSTKAFTKLMEDIDFIELDAKQYPLTHAAITAGEIPLSTFFRKKEQYFLLNDNWELWERMLKLHKDTAVALAVEVSKRTTYEKDLMSYFYFVLEELPQYLKQQTGYKWTCSPKLVESPSELEPPKAEENGVAKRRSALTPIVDNEKHTVVVPYASLAMPGRQTTYCYSHNYAVLRRGFTFNGNVVMKDIEERLNGRDDYGLMFYTLTGSMQGRGYPTFLIIFERLKNKTRVHFHRTHPSRSKEGDYNAVHNWVKTSYNWMVGNINRTMIKAQQGDLVFVENQNPQGLAFNKQVTDYDHHRFQKPVMFAEYQLKEKTNILGYFQIEQPTLLEHNEHENVMIPPGVYTLFQCRSWESNPAGVWSLRID